jgi:hypothetical protein
MKWKNFVCSVENYCPEGLMFLKKKDLKTKIIQDLQIHVILSDSKCSRKAQSTKYMYGGILAE